MKLKHAVAGLAAGLATSTALAIVTVADNVRRGDQGVLYAADTPNVFEWNATPGAGFAPAGDLFFYGAGLALVRPYVSLVPEPAACALMLCGLALLGARVRGCASRSAAPD